MTTIQLRRGSSADWTAANPVLSQGEVGVEIDTNKFKIGDGSLTWNSLPYYISERISDAKYLNSDGDTIFGPFTVSRFSPQASGTIEAVEDPGNPGGGALEVRSDDGIIIRGPYFVLDTQNPVLTMTGAVVGSPLIVVGFDSLGGAILGWGAPVVPAYDIQDTTETPVTIKAGGTPINQNWVPLGLTITIDRDIAIAEEVLFFESILVNSTSRTGTVEFGVSINGADPISRDVFLQISSNFSQVMAISAINRVPASSGDVLDLRARVTQNNNNQFELIMAASASEPAIFRLRT